MSACPDCSASRSVSALCPGCSATVTGTAWERLDLRAQPHLAPMVRAGRLNQLACPTCGADVELDCALLVLLPTDSAPLILCPAEGTSQEQDRLEGRRLVAALQQAMGAEWRDEWVKSLAYLPRTLLPVVLAQGVAAAVEHLRLHGPLPQQERVRRAALEALRRYQASGSDEDCELAVYGLARAVVAQPAGAGGLMELRLRLGQLLLERYTAKEDPMDLYGAIKALQDAVDQAPAADVPASVWEALGQALIARHALTGAPEDLRGAEQAARQAQAMRAATGD